MDAARSWVQEPHLATARPFTRCTPQSEPRRIESASKGGGRFMLVGLSKGCSPALRQTVHRYDAWRDDQDEEIYDQGPSNGVEVVSLLSAD